MADMSQVNIEEMTRVYGKEEMARIMKEIIENNVMMLKLQKQRREYEERWEEEEQRRQKEKEEVEEKKRVDEKWRRVEEMRA